MKTHDLLVIGAGPGGYVCAIRGAQLGLNVGVIEKNSRLGGTCLRVGCIPSKALLESSERYVEARDSLGKFGVKVENVEFDLPTMLGRKDEVVKTLTDGVAFLMKKNKITRYEGAATFTGPHTVVVGDEEIEAKNIIIATGSKPSPLRGIEFDYDIIGTSTEALSYPTVPEHLIVIGGGYIGMELGSVWARLGAKVTVLEYFPFILAGLDREIADEALKIFKKQGIEFKLGVKVVGAKTEGDEAIVEIESDGKTEQVRADRVLVAVGRVPNTDDLGLDSVGVKLDERGRVVVGENFATNVANIYAIGDVIAGPMLAHKATEEGVACVEKIVTGYGHVDYNTIPGIVYTAPELASVGQSEDNLKELNVE